MAETIPKEGKQYLVTPESEGGERRAITLWLDDFQLKPKKDYSLISDVDLIREWERKWLVGMDEWVEPEKPRKKKKQREEAPPKSFYTIIGFDTEYQGDGFDAQTNTRAALDERNEKIRRGELHNEVLSYQFHVSIHANPAIQDLDHNFDLTEKNVLLEYNGIIIPESGELDDRLSLEEFVTFALSEGRQHGICEWGIPTDIYLLAHFSRADIPAFKDFRDTDVDRQKLNLSNVRNTFTTAGRAIKKKLPVKDSVEGVEVTITLRDTMLLSPSSEDVRSLADIGETIGVEKVELEAGDIEKMKELRERDWEKFREYAIVDAEIAARYGIEILNLNYELTENYKLPVTLTSMGVTLLEKKWEETRDETAPPNSKSRLDRLEIVGKEWAEDGEFNERKQAYFYKKKEIFIDKISWRSDFVTETYHGGRNEQFCFGASEEDDWVDYDLARAYPTAMGFIGKPDWERIDHILSLEDLLRSKPTDLAFASVKFEFGKTIKYPVLPVRTLNGIIFPREGISNCSIPEILLAIDLGAKIEFRHGAFVPTDPDIRIFEPFVKDCNDKRAMAEKEGNKLKGLFWKELSNSTYGKTAQGLRERRVFDLRDKKSITLAPSKITNPFFASFITSFTRAVLGEVMNALPSDKDVFSVTTDGFLTNASESDMEKTREGRLASLYIDERRRLGATEGNQDFLEIKHKAKQLLGWKTRGQATLKPATAFGDEDKNYVLARGGISVDRKYTKKQKNETLVKLFFNRKPDQIVKVSNNIGIRDMWEHADGNDLVSHGIHRLLNMEYDFKRRPLVGSIKDVEHEGDKFSHLYFSTQPWECVKDFQTVRRELAEYDKQRSRLNFKDRDDYWKFQGFVETRNSLKGRRSYIHVEDGDLRRLRIELVSAVREGLAGCDHIFADTEDGKGKIVRKIGAVQKNEIKMKHWQFMKILERCGWRATSTNEIYQHNTKRTFQYNNVPRTDRVLKILKKLKEEAIPNLVIEDIVATSKGLNITMQWK